MRRILTTLRHGLVHEVRVLVGRIRHRRPTGYLPAFDRTLPTRATRYGPPPGGDASAPGK